MAYVRHEGKRGCGRREEDGLYAVSSGGTVGGTIDTSCNFVALRERIPLPKDAPDPGRGFVYINGENTLDGGPSSTWGIHPRIAEVVKLTWELWGMGQERLGAGVCRNLYGMRQAMDALDKLTWKKEKVDNWTTWSQTLISAVDNLREQWGDCPLVPAIMESRRLRWLGPIANQPTDTLAACWRLVTAISWATEVPEAVLDAVATIMKAIKAGADVPLLKQFRCRNEEETNGKPDL